MPEAPDKPPGQFMPGTEASHGFFNDFHRCSRVFFMIFMVFPWFSIIFVGCRGFSTSFLALLGLYRPARIRFCRHEVLCRPRWRTPRRLVAKTRAW